MKQTLRSAGYLPVLFILTLAGCQSGAVSPEHYFPMPDPMPETLTSDVQDFAADTLLTGLNRPWGIEFLPDGRVLIAERNGTIQVTNGVRERTVVMEPHLPEGLRDLRIHPDFEENGWLYFSVYVDPDEEGHAYSKLMRATVDGNQLIDIEELYAAGPVRGGGGWTGSRIAFDREGYLFFAVGIRGERMNAQDLLHHSGKTMRLHEDGSIPEDNPFVGRDDALPEIYSYGHREHQALVPHPERDEIWSNEHGEFGGDELNRLEKEGNYGWPLATYSLEYDSTYITPDTLLDGTVPPIHHWTPSISPSGMDFNRGERYEGWDGDLFVGSLRQRLLNRTTGIEEGEPKDEHLLPHVGRVRQVRSAPDGFIYFVTEDTGLLIRLLPA